MSLRHVWSGGITPPFLTTALNGDEWLPLRSGRFNPRERTHAALSMLFIIVLSGVRLSPLGTVATNWPVVPAPDGR
jgi:hypothetical protein